MSRIAYFDVFVGASGDMILGALVDAGLPLHVLQETVEALGLGNAVSVQAERVHKGAIAGTKVTVVTQGEPDQPHAHLRLPASSPEEHEHSHRHDHAPDHDHEHHHAHTHDHSHGHEQHEHRALNEIVTLIKEADLPDRVKERAIAVFRRLAEAEARVHGIPVDEIHFHEVGALDAVVDIVGCVMGLHALGVERVVASPIPLTRGYVETAHGRLPVPAPATMMLLEGVPVRGLDLEAETVTPTGAALLTTLADAFGPVPPMRVERVGHGAGTMDLPLPNMLRVLLGAPVSAQDEGPHAHAVVLLSTNVDDMPGEWFGPLFDELLSAGALDVWFTPVQMKKGRPGVVISALTSPDRAEAVRDILLLRTTTLGVREELLTRWCLPREEQVVNTRWGQVRVKVARLPNGAVRAKPEFDDCQALAREHGVNVWDVYYEAVARWREVGNMEEREPDRSKDSVSHNM